MQVAHRPTYVISTTGSIPVVIRDRLVHSFGALGLLVSLALASACAPTSSTPVPPVEEPDPGGDENPVSVMAHAIYAPDPDPKELKDTAAARFHRIDGLAVIGFCIDVHGQTTDFEVLEPFPGDPKIDEILIATIAKWRFKPFVVNGRAMKTCTKKTFKLKFAGGPPQPIPSAGPADPLGPLPDSVSRDACVHIHNLAAAGSTTLPSDADLERSIHECSKRVEAERKVLGEEVFERQMRCVLAAQTLAELVECEQ